MSVTVSPEKKDQDAFWVEDSGGPGDCVLDGVQIAHGKGQFSRR